MRLGKLDNDKLNELIIPDENEKQDLFTVLFRNRKEKDNEK